MLTFASALPSGPLLLLLDFDGTLVDIADTPDGIRVPRGLPGLLRALRDAGHAVTVVTGRAAAFVEERLGGAVPVVGLHGLDWPGEDPPPRDPGLDEAAAQVRAALADAGLEEGVLIEDKARALGFHYRQVPAPAEGDVVALVRARLDEVCRAHADLCVLAGHKVLELRPKVASKARAVERLCAEHPGRPVLYVGDDATDEEAFAALPTQGVSVRVGPEGVETCAQVRVDAPADVVDALRELAAR